jgi:hypothetical protein
MSDYLNTLVARTLRLGPVVQPRLASLFEPVSPGPANQPASEVSETRSLEEALPRPTAELSQRTEKKEPNTESSVTNERAGVVLQSQPMRATVLPAPAMPPPPFAINDTADTREVRDEELRLPSARTDSITTSSKTDSNTTPSRIKPEVRIISTAIDRGQIQPLHSVPAHAAPPSPLSSARNAGTQASTPAEAPEAVVVTIGRVDVRAIFPPSPAPPRSHRIQQQSMSLDEYLKQRSEGRR